MKELKTTLIIFGLLSIFTTASLFLPTILYTIVIVILLSEYFILLGGTLNWLNAKSDIDFKETGLIRRMLAVDAKLILFSAFIVLWISFWFDNVSVNYISPFEYFKWIFSGKLNECIPFSISNSFLPISVLVGILRSFFIGQVLSHGIHQLIVIEKMTGTTRIKYPIITKMVYRGMLWAKS